MFGIDAKKFATRSVAMRFSGALSPKKWRRYWNFSRVTNCGTAPALKQAMRRIRRLTQVLLSVIGTLVILYAVLRVDGTYNRVLVAALGLLLLEAGIWE